MIVNISYVTCDYCFMEQSFNSRTLDLDDMLRERGWKQRFNVKKDDWEEVCAGCLARPEKLV